MTKPVSVPNTFATATTTIPLSQLDGNFTNVANSINDANTYSNYAADTGVANAYLVTLSGVSTTYSAGLRIQFKATNANTGASTLNVNGGGVKNITFQNAAALTSGTITANSIVDVMYDGTQFLLMNDPFSTGKYAPQTTGTAILKGNGSGGFSSATAGTDYVAPGGALGTPSSGTLTNCTFPTLNQNTTGTAAGLSATLVVGSGGTGVTTTPTNGQLLIGNGTNYTVANLTVSPPLSITNTAGGIALSAAGLGVGDVVGPASATDNAIARFDSTTGKIIQNSSATVTDAGFLTANGLTFPATAVLSADPNTLDDYEEGTFTPVYDSELIRSGDIVVTYTATVGKGRYIKIGKTVFFTIDLFTQTVTVVGSTGSRLSITGLPFEVAAALGTYAYSPVVNGYFWTTTAPSYFAPSPATTTANLGYKTSPESTTMNALLDSSLTTSGTFKNELSVQGFYQTNA